MSLLCTYYENSILDKKARKYNNTMQRLRNLNNEPLESLSQFWNRDVVFRPILELHHSADLVSSFLPVCVFRPEYVRSLQLHHNSTLTALIFKKPSAQTAYLHARRSRRDDHFATSNTIFTIFRLFTAQQADLWPRTGESAYLILI
jgi:hypothetical protein